MAGSRFLEASLVHKRTASLEIRMLLYNELHHNVLCTFVRFYNTSLYGNSNFFLYLSLPMANFKCAGQDQGAFTSYVYKKRGAGGQKN